MSVRSMVVLSLLTTTAAGSTAVANDRIGASMYRMPDISNNEIVFAYANDLWRVPIEGGTALPLASPSGVESMPRFSPDGTEVAFVGNYDGGRDIYIVPVAGGLPHRVTHHPSGERLSDWTADGDLLFRGDQLSDRKIEHLESPPTLYRTPPP